MKKLVVLALVLCTFSISQAQITKRVLVEKFTSAGCGNCPNGTAELLNITSSQSDIIWISHHAGWINDAMGFPEIDSIADDFTVGAPMATIDRVLFPMEGSVAVPVGQFQTRINTQSNQVADVSVIVDGNYDPTTRFVNIEVRANFPMSVTAQNEYRINLMVVEDSVIGSGSGYDQSNYFNNNSGHYYQNAGNPILNYPHRNVSRATLSTAWGNGGIIPNTPMAGMDYVANYSYQLPMAYDETKIKFVAFVTDFNAGNVSQREVLNANEKRLMNFGMITNTRALSLVNDFQIVPNPVTDLAIFKINSTKNQSIYLEISNLAGQIIPVQNGFSTYYSLNEGQNILEIPTSELSNGLYFVTIRNGNRLMSKKMMVNR